LPYCGIYALQDFRPLILYGLRSILARRPARNLDGAIVTVLTVVALFYCYEFEVFPADSRPHTLELDELFFVSTLFFGGLLFCALRRLVQRESEAGEFITEPISGGNFGTRFEAIGKPVGIGAPGRPSKSAEIRAAIEALAAEGVELPKLSRKDACARVRQRAAKHGASIEVGFSDPVIQRSLVRRYGPRI
jgi:hypothetical protein